MMRAAWALVGVVLFMLVGCASFSSSREACVGPVDTRKEAAAVIVPHLASAMLCAAPDATDAAIKACVVSEFESIKAEASPVVYQCALALIGDVVTAAKK